MESFFKTLKVERIYHTRYETRAQARLDIVNWIEGYHNRRRLHSLMGIVLRSKPRKCSWLHSMLYVEPRQGQACGDTITK